MSDSKCSSRSLRPKTLEELDMRLAALAIGWDGVLAEVPLFSAMIAEILKILRGLTFLNDDYYPRLPLTNLLWKHIINMLSGRQP